jgi:hypothetical protein
LVEGIRGTARTLEKSDGRFGARLDAKDLDALFRAIQRPGYSGRARRAQ